MRRQGANRDLVDKKGGQGCRTFDHLIQSQVTDFRDSKLVVSTKPTDFYPRFYRVW